MIDNSQTVQLYITTEHKCSYISEQMASTVFIDPSLSPNIILYEQLANKGFRRSGKHIYKPECKLCDRCISTRIPVEKFALNRRFKRALKKNIALSKYQIKPQFTDEYFELYSRYIKHQHADGDMYPPNKKQFVEFLLDDWPGASFIEWRLDNRLVCVAVTDVMENAWSAVYTFYEPQLSKLSLGTFSILEQIRLAKLAGCQYLYLGYWIKDCHKMAYKGDFRPIQCFFNNQWVELS